jgi:hypothetical protein
MTQRFGPAYPAAVRSTRQARIRRVPSRRLRRGAVAAGLLLSLAAATVSAAPELVAGVFRFSQDSYVDGEDANTQLWMRNPLVLDDHLVFRAKEGRWSSIYAYRLDELASGIGSWAVEPAAVGPPRADIRAQETSPFQAPAVPTITALFRGPAYAGLLPGGAPDGTVSLWPLGAGGFEPAAPGAYKDLLQTGGNLATATAQTVDLAGKRWLDCADGKHEPACAAIVTHGLSAAVTATGRLAIAFADPGERRHVCVLDKPGQRCSRSHGNIVDGRLPRLSPDGALLAVAEEQRLDDGHGEHAGWDIVIYGVAARRNGPLLEPLHRIAGIRLYGDTGQGGDFVAYDGSYDWLDDRLFYQRPGVQRGLESWSRDGGTRAWSLPSEIAVSSVAACGPQALKDQFLAETLPAEHWDRLIWVPAPGTNGVACDDNTVLPTDILLRLVDIYAVQPLELQGTGHVVVQALVESLAGPDQRRTPLERILIFRLD